MQATKYYPALALAEVLADLRRQGQRITNLCLHLRPGGGVTGVQSLGDEMELAISPALAAQRAGLKRIVVPRDNEPDLEELPEETRKELSFFLVDSIGEVFDVAFGDGAKVRPKAAPSPERQAALGR